VKQADLGEAKKLFGTWQATGGETGREKLSTADVRRTRVSFDYTHVTLGEDARTTEADYRLDPAKIPKQIDLTLTGAEKKGETLLGIYRLEGGHLDAVPGGAGAGPTRPVQGRGRARTAGSAAVPARSARQQVTRFTTPGPATRPPERVLAPRVGALPV